MTITAIQTRYKGCLFRSRLEARWAVFLDALRVPWEYEKQGYVLDGYAYLPDFWLPQQRQWMEVKGERNRDGWDVAHLLAKNTGHSVCIMHGEFCCRLSRDGEANGHGYCWYGDDRKTWPADPDVVWWGRCPRCGLYGIGFCGHHGICGCRHAPSDYPSEEAFVDSAWDWCNPGRHATILAAYIAARSARFEFGETPQ